MWATARWAPTTHPQFMCKRKHQTEVCNKCFGCTAKTIRSQKSAPWTSSCSLLTTKAVSNPFYIDLWIYILNCQPWTLDFRARTAHTFIEWTHPARHYARFDPAADPPMGQIQGGRRSLHNARYRAAGARGTGKTTFSTSPFHSTHVLHVSIILLISYSNCSAPELPASSVPSNESSTWARTSWFPPWCTLIRCSRQSKMSWPTYNSAGNHILGRWSSTNPEHPPPFQKKTLQTLLSTNIESVCVWFFGFYTLITK